MLLVRARMVSQAPKRLAASRAGATKSLRTTCQHWWPTVARGATGLLQLNGDVHPSGLAVVVVTSVAVGATALNAVSWIWGSRDW